MSVKLSPGQSSQSISSALTITVTGYFSELPQELIEEILKRVDDPKDVENLNFVSKFITALNQDSKFVDPRAKALFEKFTKCRDIEICDLSKCNYRNYIGLYSFFLFYRDANKNARPYYEISKGGNSLPAVPKLTIECYNALPADLQTKLKRNIWEANAQNDEGHGIFFGEHVINTNIGGDLVRSAVRNCILDACKKMMFKKRNLKPKS